MLVELRDIEVHVEPDEILEQAIRDGDLSVSDVMSIARDEFDRKDILDCFEEDEMQEYLGKQTIPMEEIFNATKAMNEQQKALLVWQLLRG